MKRSRSTPAGTRADGAAKRGGKASPRTASSARFTPAFLDNVRSASLMHPGRAEYGDADCPALRVRVSKGRAVFSVLQRVKGGDPKRVTLGDAEDITIKDARAAARRVSAVLRNAPAIASEYRAAPAGGALAAFAEFVADVRAFLSDAEHGLEPDLVRLRRALEAIGAAD